MVCTKDDEDGALLAVVLLGAGNIMTNVCPTRPVGALLMANIGGLVSLPFAPPSNIYGLFRCRGFRPFKHGALFSGDGLRVVCLAAATLCVFGAREQICGRISKRETEQPAYGGIRDGAFLFWCFFVLVHVASNRN